MYNNQHGITKSLSLIVVILTFLRKQPMKESEIKKRIYAVKQNIFEINEVDLLQAYAKLYDEKYIELERIDEEDSIVRITEYGISIYEIIMSKFSNDFRFDD
ncbi:MAG TPA: hypothetical protein DEB10_13175 [Ruminococcaceae bacterium]|nr:hypothetical protein [Oscillospiraceae bacterium]